MSEKKIYVAGHRGMAGSAIVRKLLADGISSRQIVARKHQELDLRDESAVDRFFAAEKPDEVYLAAARVGGIHANDVYPAEFIHDNLAIQTNVIDAAHRHGVSRLLFLGSSCIYPKLATQPMTESALLTGSLEPTNRPYAIAKIAGIEMCWSYNRQYGTQFLAMMPTNLYGRGDNYHPENSHVLPALIRRFHEAKTDKAETVTIWGTGAPRREFMYVDDMADACVHVMGLPDRKFRPLLGADRNDGLPPMLNVGVGTDITIGEAASLVAKIVGFDGAIEYDSSKPDGAPRKLMDSSRLQRLGWSPKVPLETGVELTYKDFVASHAGE